MAKATKQDRSAFTRSRRRSSSAVKKSDAAGLAKILKAFERRSATARAGVPASRRRGRRPASSSDVHKSLCESNQAEGARSSSSTSRSDGRGGMRSRPAQRRRRPPLGVSRRWWAVVSAGADRRVLLEGPPASSSTTTSRRSRSPDRRWSPTSCTSSITWRRADCARRPFRGRTRSSSGWRTRPCWIDGRAAGRLRARPRRRLAAVGAGCGTVPLRDQGPFRHAQDLEETEQRFVARPTRRRTAPPARAGAAVGDLTLERPDAAEPARSDLRTQRRTWREFGREPLDASRGRSGSCGGSGASAGGSSARRARQALRSSPSAGARQVLDVYLVAVRVRGPRARPLPLSP